MRLIWKVGDTYHLCGDGFETEIHTAVAGDSFRLFLPVFDSTEGIRFMDRLWPVGGSSARGRESTAEGMVPSLGARKCRFLEEGEPTEN